MNERYRTRVATNEQQASLASLPVLDWVRRAPKPVRAMLYLAAGAAVAFPLAACQPQGGAARSALPASRPSDTASATTTDGGTTPATAEPTVREVIIEKPVYVDRPAAEKDEVLASVKGIKVQTAKDVYVRMSQVRGPLLESYGMAVVLRVMQLELAKINATERGIKLVPADVQSETDMRIAQLFPDADKSEYPNLVDRLLQQTGLTMVEFNMTMETNAYLRRIARALMKEPPTEEQLQEAFNVLYGESIKVRHIACNNMTEIGEAQRQLAAGIPFETVARTVSRNARTAPLGGELPSITRATPDIAQNFKDAAFALKEGEVSDVINANNQYHLIKLDQRIPPKAVKFEDVKSSLLERLGRSAEDAAIKEWMLVLARQVAEVIEFEDPILRKQWAVRKAQLQQQARDTAASPTGVPQP